MNKTGFTLIEVLIALSIISIAITAIIKASSQDIRASSYVQDKMMATWVGWQVLNEARVGLHRSLDLNESLKHTTTLLGRKWSWHLKQSVTPNAHINKINVQVFAEGKEDEEPLINLESYLYRVQT